MITFDISPAEEKRMIENLRKFPVKVREQIAFAAVLTATVPLVAAAKSMAPVDSGSLRQSIGAVMRVKKRRTYAVIGAVRGMGTEGNEPANYAHLVEFGHRIAHAKTGKFDRAKEKKKRVKLAPHGEVPPKPFMRPAWEATKGAVLGTLKQTLSREIEALALKTPGKRVSGK